MPHSHIIFCYPRDCYVWAGEGERETPSSILYIANLSTLCSTLTSIHTALSIPLRCSPLPLPGRWHRISHSALSGLWESILEYPGGLYQNSPRVAHDGYFYVSAWQGHRVPRYLGKHYSGCVCAGGCVWMRFIFELVDWVKPVTCLMQVGWAHPLEAWMERRGFEGTPPACRLAGTLFFPCLWTGTRTVAPLGSHEGCWLSA